MAGDGRVINNCILVAASGQNMAINSVETAIHLTIRETSGKTADCRHRDRFLEPSPNRSPSPHQARIQPCPKLHRDRFAHSYSLTIPRSYPALKTQLSLPHDHCSIAAAVASGKSALNHKQSLQLPTRAEMTASPSHHSQVIMALYKTGS